MGILYIADMHGKFPTLSPDLDKHNLVLLGDMVNNGTEYEYRKLGKWIESVKRPDRRIWRKDSIYALRGCM